MRNVLVVGATSAIAQAVVKRFAGDGDNLFLVARNPAKLQIVADDARVRGASRVGTLALDMTELDKHREMLNAAEESIGALDVVFVAYGTLPDQKACEASVEKTLEALSVNAISVIALLTLVANDFEQRRHGTIAVISSVAGDRGRQSNYVYGTAKAAVSTFTQGLRNRLFRSGVKVVTIKPGFVDTPMTAHIKKGPLFASADSVGSRIYKAIVNGEDVVYVPWFWAVIMWVIKAIPESLFKRLKL